NLHFSAYNTGDTCLMDTMYYRMITATETSGWFVYNTPDTIWTLSQTDGLKTLTLQVKDWFGNIAQSSAMITLDMTAPTVNEFVLNNGINVTTETQIILTFSVSDNLSGVYDTMVISGSIADMFETNLVSPKTVFFTNENGFKTLSAVFRDNAGNSVTVSDSILLDNSGPSFVFTPVTWADTTQSVNFQFYVTDYNYVKYVKLFYIDIDSSAQLSNLTEISANGNDSNVLSGTLTIPNRTSNALDSGYIYYYLESSDSINNKSYYVLSGESKSAPDDITKLLKLQRIDFSAPSISINQGAYTNNVTCSVVINAVSVSGIALTGGKIYGDITNTVNITDTAITNYGISLTEANGLKTIYCVYVDAMGNTSPAGTASIFFDNVNPVVTLSIGSADVTNETAQLIALTYSDSTPCRDTYEVESSSDITYGAGDTMIAYPTTVILTSGDGIKTVTVKMYDSAGNMAEASDTIILDQTGPVFTFSPVTWADTTESIEIVFTATDNYSNIIGAKLFYIEMDSAANVSNKVELLKQGVDGKILNETFIIPARTSSAADSGSVYYYIGCADSWYNVRYYGASGQT
ncbi:MAG TPA: hypothetical protein PKY81_18025, partial [bacterium]|nr:hypothetical protein [bacterium]